MLTWVFERKEFEKKIRRIFLYFDQFSKGVDSKILIIEPELGLYYNNIVLWGIFNNIVAKDILAYRIVSCIKKKTLLEIKIQLGRLH